MSDLHFYDEDEEIPLPRPRAEVRFTQVTLHPYPDGRRVKLHFALTPFMDRPSVDIRVVNLAGQEVATLSLIEAMDTENDFTIHLRGPEPRGAHTLEMVLFYRANDDPEAEREVIETHTTTFEAGMAV